MRFSNFATLVVASVVAVACSEREAATPTTPDSNLRFTRGAAAPCDAATDRTIKQQQMDLFAGAVLNEAQLRWTAVESACSPTNADAANAALLYYVQYTVSVYPNGVQDQKKGTKESAFLNHWNTIFPYVGYPAPALPIGTNGPLGPQGAVGVISPTGGARELNAANAALTLAEQSATGDQRWHLFAIYPLSAGCLVGSTLAQTGPCFEFASFPSVSPSWNPLIRVGVCEPVHAGEPIPGNIPALGHLLQNGKVEIAGQVLYPTFCADLPVADIGSWSGGFGSVMKRLAWIGKRALSVNVAYGSHGGLGGDGGFISPFGAVDLMVFHATFSTPPNVVGQAPGAPEVGTFTQSATSPGTILVQSSLGQYTGPLAVLSQAGGNCNNCGGLLLQGNLFTASGSPASDGVFEATWNSLQDAPSVKEAPFILRDDSGREIARVSYKTVSSQNQLYYNGSLIATTWTRHVSQSFKIQVNFTTRKTSLWIDNVLIADSVDFYNTSAANFAQIAADFRGIDSGVMGWDEVTVVRKSDH